MAMPQRILIFIALMTLALVASWLAEHPGTMELQWLDYEIKTSAAFLLVALTVLVLTLWFLIKLLIGLLHFPKDFKQARKIVDHERGLEALTEAFIALGERDHDRARQQIGKAERYLPSPTLPRLMQLQLVQQSGQIEKLKTQFKLLESSPQTRPIALKGLIEEARRFGRMEEALQHAETLLSLQPRDPSAVRKVIDIYSYHHRWQEALQIAIRAQNRRIIPREEIRSLKTAIYMEQAETALEERNRSSATELLKSALKMDPGHTSAAAKLADIYLQTGKKGLAVRVLRRAWKFTPHPDLAAMHQKIYEDLPADKQLRKAKDMVKGQPAAIESQLTVARAAIKAEQWETARNHLKIALTKQETVTACKLMAELEEKEHQDESESKRWLERAAVATADPVWQCGHCGHQPKRWRAHCRKCYHFNAIRWTLDRFLILPADAA